MEITREAFIACFKVGISLFVVFLVFWFVPDGWAYWIIDVVDIKTFVGAVNDLNVGLVFAAFLAIFTSSENVAVKDMKKHPAFRAALLRIVVNSFVMCALVAFREHVYWMSIGFLFGMIVLFISNFRMMWGLVKIDVTA